MILGAEIALLILGLVAIFRGKLTLTKARVVEGTPARLLGLLGLAPIPVTIALCFAIGVVQGATGTFDQGAFKTTAIIVEGCVLLVCIVLLYTIGFAFAGLPGSKRARKEMDDLYEDAEERFSPRHGEPDRTDIRDPSSAPPRNRDDRIRE
jgi:hypothetical protein